jgi:soluble lytic murein transglycosylase
MRKSRLIFPRYNPSRRKRRRKQIALASRVGVGVLLIGTTLLAIAHSNQLKQWALELPFQEQGFLVQGKTVSTPVLKLVSLPPAKRTEKLEALALARRSVALQNSSASFVAEPKSLDSARARYLLAADAIALQQGEQALRWLEGLEWDYPVLAGHIALKRAQAYELTGNKAKALSAWQDLLKRYPDNPVAAEALYALSSNDPKYWEKGLAKYPPSNYLVEITRHLYNFSAYDPQYWEQAVRKYPAHPRILEIAQQRLKQNPKQPQLMVLLAKYAFDQSDVTPVLDKLVGNYSQPRRKKDRKIIQPEDWEAIALGYWKAKKYGQASAAYAKAPRTPRNAYLAALGLQYAEELQDAKRAYKQMLYDFPNANETATGLLQLAQIEPDVEVVPYLDRVISQFPNRAGEALLAKAETLDKVGSSQAAEETRQLLLTKYGNSEAAAEYRWQVAQSKASDGDLQAAFEWAKPIIVSNPKSQLTRQAGFWVGKWANKLGYQQEAQAAFEQVIDHHPQSYYAWRSAVQLGWNVADFSTVRELDPQLVLPAIRSALPAGSPALKELYQLGQDRDAWTLWQAEFKNRIQPTVAEQFTDGLLRLGVGDYLEGISRISSLEDRDTPEEQAQYQALKQQLRYWQALYPFPFVELIEAQSQHNDLNPLLVTALIRQESRFEPEIRSQAGAVGLMQMMPSTGAWAAKHVDLNDYALDNPDHNIKLGTWFLDQVHRSYDNNSLLAIASYNAGQGNMAKWLKTHERMDPDEFVEAIPFPETKNYVKQVFGNYWNYSRLYDPQVQAQLDKHYAGQSTAMRQ